LARRRICKQDRFRSRPCGRCDSNSSPPRAPIDASQSPEAGWSASFAVAECCIRLQNRREPRRPIAFHLSCCGINVCRRAADPFAIVFRLLLWRAKPLRYSEIEAGRTAPAQEFGQSFGEFRIESEASHRVGLFDNARNVADKNHGAPPHLKPAWSTSDWTAARHTIQSLSENAAPLKETREP